MGMKGRPTRLSGDNHGDRLAERAAGRNIDVVQALQLGRLGEIDLTITFSARMAKVAEFPTEVVGMMAPSEVMATASTTATSIGPNCLVRRCSTVSDKC